MALAYLISLLRIVEDGRPGVAHCHFGQVPIVISLHLQVEHLGFGVAGLGDQKLIQQSLKKIRLFLDPRYILL